MQQPESKLKLDESKDGNSENLQLEIDLKSSDVKQNTTAALQNILSLLDGDGSSQKPSLISRTSSNFEQILQRGKVEMQSDLAQAISAAVPQIDSFVDFVDGIVQVCI